MKIITFTLRASKICFSFLVILIFVGCQEKVSALQEFNIQGETQGTTYAVKYFASTDIVKKESIDSLLRLFDLSLSTYEPLSIVSKINRNEAVEIDSFFLKNYEISKEIFLLTNGLFDPTIGTLVNAYGFGPEKTKRITSESDISKIMTVVGFDQVSIQNMQVVKKHDETYLDFNAIAQGYAVDVLADFLKSKNITDGLVEIGGEIFAFGQNQSKKKSWVVGIEDPVRSTEFDKVILEKAILSNKGLATSGNYRKIKTDSLTGKKFVHIIHPKTGEAKQTSILSATVVSPSTAKSDALATALTLMTIDEIKLFSEKHNEFSFIVVYQDINDEVKVFKSTKQ